jgi:hypothetical protein
MAGDLIDVFLDVDEVEGRFVVGGGSLLDVCAHEGERQRGEGEVGSWGVGWLGLGLFGVVALVQQ